MVSVGCLSLPNLPARQRTSCRMSWVGGQVAPSDRLPSSDLSCPIPLVKLLLEPD